MAKSQSVSAGVEAFKHPPYHDGLARLLLTNLDDLKSGR
jgi:hypothetical protein